MQKFLSLAIRNVFRNKRRTLMTLLVVSGGVAGLLLTGGFFAFMFRGLREQTIRNRLGHLQMSDLHHGIRSVRAEGVRGEFHRFPAQAGRPGAVDRKSTR